MVMPVNGAGDQSATEVDRSQEGPKLTQLKDPYRLLFWHVPLHLTEERIQEHFVKLGAPKPLTISALRPGKPNHDGNIEWGYFFAEYAIPKDAAAALSIVHDRLPYSFKGKQALLRENDRIVTANQFNSFKNKKETRISTGMQPLDKSEHALVGSTVEDFTAYQQRQALHKLVKLLQTRADQCWACKAADGQHIEHLHYIISERQLLDPHEDVPALEELFCATCGSTDRVSKCVGCGEVFYCRRQCQLSDWPNHSQTCASKMMHSIVFNRSSQISPPLANSTCVQTTPAEQARRQSLINERLKHLTPDVSKLHDSLTNYSGGMIPIDGPLVNLSNEPDNRVVNRGGRGITVTTSSSRLVSYDAVREKEQKAKELKEEEARRQEEENQKRQAKLAQERVDREAAEKAEAAHKAEAERLAREKEQTEKIRQQEEARKQAEEQAAREVAERALQAEADRLAAKEKAECEAAEREQAEARAVAERKAAEQAAIQKQIESVRVTSVAPSTSASKDYRCELLTIDHPIKAPVVWVEKKKFFLQPNGDKVENIGKVIEAQVATQEEAKDLQEGRHVLAKASDGLFYRGVIKVLKAGKAGVLFVDYGNCEAVAVQDIKELPDSITFEKIPAQAIMCRIDENQADYDEALAKINKAYNSFGNVKVTPISQDGQCYITKI